MRKCNGSCSRWAACKKNRFNPCQDCKFNVGDVTKKSYECERCCKNTCAYEPKDEG